MNLIAYRGGPFDRAFRSLMLPVDMDLAVPCAACARASSAFAEFSTDYSI